MTKHVAINAILAIGVTFVILTGGIDLSVGSIAGLSSMIVGGLLFRASPCPVAASSGLSVLVVHPDRHRSSAASSGGSTASLITKFQRATVHRHARHALRRARRRRAAQQRRAPSPTSPAPRLDGNTGLPVIGSDQLVRRPRRGLDHGRGRGRRAIVVTPRRRSADSVYAVGGNERAALLSGIRVSPGQAVAVYVISGACAALAGISSPPSSAPPTRTRPPPTS